MSGSTHIEKRGEGVLTLGSLIFDTAHQTLTRAGSRIQLTTGEFNLLLYLARQAGRVVTRDELYANVLGIEYDGLNRTIDIRISRLRRKLSGQADPLLNIKSIRSEGYILVLDRLNPSGEGQR